MLAAIAIIPFYRNGSKFCGFRHNSHHSLLKVYLTKSMFLIRHFKRHFLIVIKTLWDLNKTSMVEHCFGKLIIIKTVITSYWVDTHHQTNHNNIWTTIVYTAMYLYGKFCWNFQQTSSKYLNNNLLSWSDVCSELFWVDNSRHWHWLTDARFTVSKLVSMNGFPISFTSKQTNEKVDCWWLGLFKLFQTRNDSIGRQCMQH